jgi:aconitate hydratase
MANSFDSRSTLQVGKRTYEIHRLSALKNVGFAPDKLPFSLRILLENLLRCEDGRAIKEGCRPP